MRADVRLPHRHRIASCVIFLACTGLLAACGHPSAKTADVAAGATTQSTGSSHSATAEQDGKRKVDDQESASVVEYEVLYAPSVPGWHRLDRELWTYSLDQLTGPPKHITWVTDTYQPDDPGQANDLAGVQFNQAPLPEDPATRKLPTQELANGLTVYVSAPPEGVTKGGSVSWFTSEARYSLASTVLGMSQLLDIVGSMDLKPIQIQGT